MRTVNLLSAVRHLKKVKIAGESRHATRANRAIQAAAQLGARAGARGKLHRPLVTLALVACLANGGIDSNRPTETEVESSVEFVVKLSDSAER